MWKALFLGLMLFAAQPNGAGEVELFDTDKERVVETYANSDAFQKEARDILNSVSGRVTEISPSLDKALILKIPLAPPQQLTVRSAMVDAKIVEMFVVMPKSGTRLPWLILHTSENDTLLMEFSKKVDELKQLLKRS